MYSRISPKRLSKSIINAILAMYVGHTIILVCWKLKCGIVMIMNLDERLLDYGCTLYTASMGLGLPNESHKVAHLDLECFENVQIYSASRTG